MAIERSDAKHTTLPIEKYDGSARLGEIVADINKDPQFPSLYIGNVDQNLNYFTTASGGLNPGGNSTNPNAGPNSNTVGTLVLGDIKQSMLNVDHSGWVKMDGRAISTLTPNQRTVAIALGYPVNLPNVTGRIIKSTGAPTGTTGGGPNQVTLVATNIPKLTGAFYTNNVYRKEVIAAVQNPITNPNLTTEAPFGAVSVSVNGQVSFGTPSPNPVVIPDQPFMAINTFVFLGP